MVKASSWKLLPSSWVPSEGQMEFDRKLFKSFQDGDPPILRFFYFKKPTLTLGRLEARRSDLARFTYPHEIRPTGGRAVLHGEGDLCYAVIASSRDERVGGDLMASYQKISGLLQKAFQNLGREVELSAAPHRSQGLAHCFSAPSQCELTLGGKKVAGGAQAREKNHFLQQGVILLSVSPDWQKAFPESGTDSMVGLNDISGTAPVTRAGLEKALLQSFESVEA